MNRIARISLSALALLATFTIGMLFAQRTTLSPARAAEENPIVTAFPIRTEQSTGQTGIVTITVKEVLAIHANGLPSKRSIGSGYNDQF